MSRTRKIWTILDNDYLKKYYPIIPARCLAKKMGRTTSSIHGQAHNLMIAKSDQFKQSAWANRWMTGDTSGIQTRFSKGSIPKNKGVKMTPEQYEKSKPTMFKKGQACKNEKYDGHERVDKDGYVLIRIAKGKYVHKSRWLWEKTNGPIPKGMVVAFKDRDKLNVVPENLELITKKENMLRNTIHRFPPEVKEVIRMVSKVKRKIQEKENNK